MFARHLLTIFISTILNYGLSERACASDAYLPDLEEIGQIYAIHATYKIPEDGIMIPGKVSNGKKTNNAAIDSSIHKGDPKPGVAGWRPTLHFALGGLCPDSTENTLIDREHVIIVQVKDLKDQLIGLQPFDTFILGSFIIPANAHLIVPGNEMDQMNKASWVKEKNIKIIARTEAPLNHQIMSFLKERNSWIFMGKENEKTFIALKNNTPHTRGRDFFRSLLDASPCIDYAPHAQHRIGFFDKNAHFLLLDKLGSLAISIPGGKQLKDLLIELQNAYSKHLHRNSPLLGGLFDKAFSNLKKLAAETNGKSNELKGLHFGNDQKGMANHALTWLAKGNYLLFGKPCAIKFMVNNAPIEFSVDEISGILKEGTLMME